MQRTRSTKRRKGQNEGSVYQLPDGTWRAAVSTGAGGKRKYYRGKEAEAARKKAREALADLDMGLSLSNDAITLTQLYTRWIEARKPEIRPATVSSYKGTFRKHILPHIGRTQATKVSAPVITRLYGKLRDGGIGNSALVHVHRYLSILLKWGQRQGYLKQIATNRVDSPREEHSEMRFLSEDESRRLLAACEGERLGSVVHVLLSSGLRANECFALTWTDIDLKRRRINVNKTLTRVEGGLAVTPPKTRASNRSVPVPQGLLDVLSAHRTAMNEESLARGEDWTANHKPVFVSENGTHVSLANFTRSTFRRTLSRAGIKGRCRVHDLRHSWITQALSRGGNLAAVSRAAGHTHIATTLRYTHALDTDVDRLSTIMEAAYS